MGHHHGHEHHHHDVGNIKVAFFLNITFTIIEIIGGFYVNSVAILSDAIHDLGDSLSLGLAWYFQKLSKKGRDTTYSYGYKRFSLLGAIINSIVLVTGSVIILFEAVPRLWAPEQPDTQGMLVLAILGIIVNGAAALRLKKGTSINEKVVSLHLMEDVLGWVAVLIASLVMMFTRLPIIDPILSVAISLFILFNVYKSLKDSFKIILQAWPSQLNQTVIIEALKNIPMVEDVHDFHAWTMDGSYHVATVHLVLREGTTIEQQCEAKQKARAIIKQHKIRHATIEVDLKEEICELEHC